MQLRSIKYEWHGVYLAYIVKASLHEHKGIYKAYGAM